MFKSKPADYGSIEKDARLQFLAERGARMSSFINARAMRDKLRGETDVGESPKNVLLVSVEPGPPVLQAEASSMLGGISAWEM